jgi:hypothetical protein
MNPIQNPVGILVITWFCSAAFAPLAAEPVKVSASKETTIEAEDFVRRSSRDDHRWEKIKSRRSDVPSYIIAAPDANKVFNILSKDFEKKSPKVDYEVEFEKAGSYWIWVRAKGTAGGASVAFGMDDNLPRTEFIGFFGPQWAWVGNYRDSQRLRLEVREAGKHTLQLWMIEDGVSIDKLMLTTNPAFRPSDQ